MSEIATDILRMAGQPPGFAAEAEACLSAGPGAPGTEPGTGSEVALPAREMQFSFINFGIRFNGTIRPVGGGVSLIIEGDLGPLPFSLLSADARRRTLAILSSGKFLRDIDFSISPEQHIRLHDTRTLPRPVFARTVVASAATFLATAKPYLDQIGAELAPITLS